MTRYTLFRSLRAIGYGLVPAMLLGLFYQFPGVTLKLNQYLDYIGAAFWFAVLGYLFVNRHSLKNPKEMEGPKTPDEYWDTWSSVLLSAIVFNTTVAYWIHFSQNGDLAFLLACLRIPFYVYAIWAAIKVIKKPQDSPNL